MERWLHSYCNTCEICAVDVTACPNQHNSGRVSQYFFTLLVGHVGPVRLIRRTARTFQALFGVCAYLINPNGKYLTVTPEYTVSPVEGMTLIPDGLDSVVAAPLLCGM